MSFAAISDVHGNLEALESVLSDIEERGVDEIYFLGDAVGYGPNPNECIMLLKEKCTLLLAGNHDHAAIGLASIEHFNPYARAAILWTASVLTEDSREALGGLPLKKSMGDMLLVHSTPLEPEQWHYLLSYRDAEVNFLHFEERICLLGHSHSPFIAEKTPSGEILTYKGKAPLARESRYIINAGSVGQPRDRDPRACYALLNDREAEFIRVAYPFERTQEKMRAACLPEYLIGRLAAGT